jgi:hypothetical protein
MTDEATLRSVLERAKSLTYNNDKELDDIRKKGKMALENLFPTKSYWIEIGNIKFSQYHYTQVSESTYKKDWTDGQNELINLLDTALLDLKSKKEKAAQKPSSTKERIVIQEKIVPVIDESAIRTLREEFSGYKKSVTNWSIYAVLALLLSSSLWVMFFYSGWEWYDGHEKKLGITLMLNLTIVVGLLNIPIRQKWTIWIPAVIAVLLTIFSLI